MTESDLYEWARAVFPTLSWPIRVIFLALFAMAIWRAEKIAKFFRDLSPDPEENETDSEETNTSTPSSSGDAIPLRRASDSLEDMRAADVLVKITALENGFSRVTDALLTVMEGQKNVVNRIESTVGSVRGSITETEREVAFLNNEGLVLLRAEFDSVVSVVETLREDVASLRQAVSGIAENCRLARCLERASRRPGANTGSGPPENGNAAE